MTDWRVFEAKANNGEEMALIAQLLMIVASAVPGVLSAWWLVSLTPLDGLPKAFATVVMAMVFAVALFAGLVALGKVLKILK
jgi:hypothetical protein